jgi:DDE family transposase
VEATPNEHEEAEPLPDRSVLKSNKKDSLRYGHKYAWVVRLVQFGTSGAAPVEIERIDTETTDTQRAAVPVPERDLRDRHLKVIVADRRYAAHRCLGWCERFQHTFGLIRLHGNRVLYEVPKQKLKGSRGAPRQHGQSFKLNGAHRAADRSETCSLGDQTVRVPAWQKLHFKKLATLSATFIQVEFLKTDGTPRYKRPIWLFWTGPQNVALADLGRMSLGRFAIEHLFRFLQQHLGLNSHRSPTLMRAQQGMGWCALAYWQWLLIRDQVKADRPAGYPHKPDPGAQLTPDQVQRSALAFLLELGTPAATPRPAGKGAGRPKNYHPAHRLRSAVIFKGKKVPKSPSASPSMVFAFRFLSFPANAHPLCVTLLL